MNAEVEACIKSNLAWTKLPKNVRQLLGNSQKEYEKQVLDYSIKNQLRYKGNLIKTVRKDEEQYYKSLLDHSRHSLMLYPYHLSDIITRELRTTPFQYYFTMMEKGVQELMTQVRSYDSLPNFTAVDCLRLLGIGRNQYIDLMNQCRSTKRLTFRKRGVRELLPPHPIDISVPAWWRVQVGNVMEDDIRMCTSEEKALIDLLYDEKGFQIAGTLDLYLISSLYKKGLVYFDVPVEDDDQIMVRTLDGFVMNRVLGDYLETLLYKIFVSTDEHTKVKDLADVLQINLDLVKTTNYPFDEANQGLYLKDAVSVFCRLGFARKKNTGLDRIQLHPSWPQETPFAEFTPPDFMTVSTLTSPDSESFPFNPDGSLGGLAREASIVQSLADEMADSLYQNGAERKRIGFLFDSTLTAFLMMGNLSPSLKTHAVTLFEVGKLTEEALDSFVEELEKVQSFGEGEAERYFEHAEVLRATISWVRSGGRELDLLRCESLLGLDPSSRLRVLKKTYRLLVSMAPLTNEISPLNCSDPPHLGPPVGEVNSAWFRLFVYQLVGAGPVSILLTKGHRLSRLPAELRAYPKLLLSTWSHDPGIVHADNCLPAVNDALQHSAVFLQAYSSFGEDTEIAHVPFPGTKESRLQAVLDEEQETEIPSKGPLDRHPMVEKLISTLELSHSCGYITLLRTADTTNSRLPDSRGSSPEKTLRDSRTGLSSQDPRKTPGSVLKDASGQVYADWTLFDCVFGVPLFDRRLNSAVLASIADSDLFNSPHGAGVQRVHRELSLRVLDFVSGFQRIGGGGAEHSVPYPTHNLLFDGRRVRTL